MKANIVKIENTVAGCYLVTILERQFNVNPQVLRQMRDWVSECVWSEDCETAEFTDAEILRGVNRHFDGGIAEFFNTI